MVSTKKERTLVVIELVGGNDGLNTVVPYGNGLYYDNRPGIGIAQQDVLPIDGDYGFNPNMREVKTLWDRGELAIIKGIGYPQPNRSHFRSRDIWYTAEPETIGSQGWLGAAIRDLDARGGERPDRREFWSRPAPGLRLQGRAGGLRGQPGDLRPAPRH